MAHLNISDNVTKLISCKTFILACDNFYRQTKLIPHVNFSYLPNEKGVNFSLGFSPREATDEEYLLFFDLLLKSESFLIHTHLIDLLKTHSTEDLINKLNDLINTLVKNEDKQ